jgi:hypothetical protein
MKPNAIVVSGARTLICTVDDSVQEQDVIGDAVNLKGAYMLATDRFAFSNPMGYSMVLRDTAQFIDAETEAVDIWARVDSIRYFKNMQDKGEKYLDMINELKEYAKKRIQEDAPTADFSPEKYLKSLMEKVGAMKINPSES